MRLTGVVETVEERHVAVIAAAVAGVLILVVLLLLGGLFALGTVFFYDSYQSSYYYEGSIYVEGATDDAVFVVPVPVTDGDAVVSDIHFSDNDRFRTVDADVVETEHGPMLRIEIDEIDAESGWNRYLDFTARIESDRTIETKQPRGIEPVLSPLELAEGPEADETHRERWPDHRDFDATSTAFVEHGGEDDIIVGMMIRFEGANEWWTFGWSGNRYETSVVANEASYGPHGQWIELRGWHTEGSGNYPRFLPIPS